MPMLSTRLAAVLLLFLIPAASTALERTGTLDNNETWNVQDSPVIIEDLVTVPQGVVLTIMPGVEVRFKDGTGLMVEGALVARGTADDSIRFTADSDAGPGSWGGIYFHGAGEKPNWDDTGGYSGTGNVLEYCTIEFGGEDIFVGNSAIEISSNSPLIAHSTIRNCTGNSGTIRCSNLAEPLIYSCLISSNTATRGGAVFAGMGANPVLRENTIIQNKSSDHGGAVYISLSSAEITNNKFLGNEAEGYGGALYGAVVSDLLLHNNVFIDNRSMNDAPVIFLSDRINTDIKNNLFESDGVIVYLQNAVNDVNAAGNWWGIPSDFDIRSAIHDKNRVSTEPRVIYSPLLWAPPIDLPTNPVEISSIILCRDDNYNRQIPYGVAQGAPLRIRLEATDTNPLSRDIIGVQVISAQDPEGIVIPLKEDGPNSGVWVGRGDVGVKTYQSRYEIGDQKGGEVTIFAPFDPYLRATYKTVSPNPTVENFTIGRSEEIMHVVSHEPQFTWDYFDVIERAQERYWMEVIHLDDNEVFPVALWSTKKILSDRHVAMYDGDKLRDGKVYTAKVSVDNGKLWSDTVKVDFRMNSLPSAPQPLRPIHDELLPTRLPSLFSEIAQDPEGDSLSYVFEIYELDNIRALVQQSYPVSPSGAEVTWTPHEPLTENKPYKFRVNASDPFETGPFSDFRLFHINSVEEPPGKFGLFVPARHDTVFELQPTLQWGAAIDPDPLSLVTYNIRIDKSPDFDSPKSYQDISRISFRLPDSLDNRTEYYWEVTAVDNTGRKTMATSVGVFSVETTPSIPYLITPSSGEERQPQDVLAWYPSTDPNPQDVIKYEIEVHETPDFSNAVASAAGWNNNNIKVNELSGSEDLVDNVVYHWRVRARDNHAAVSDFSRRGSFFFNRYNDKPLMVTTITAPADTVMGSDNVRFAWKEVADPDLSDPSSVLEYDIQCVVGDFETGAVLSFSSQPGTGEVSCKLGDNRLWNYRIRSRDDEGAVSRWSSVKTVLLNVAQDPPVPFALTTPRDQSQIAELDSLRFSWTSSSDPDWESSVHYRFELVLPDGNVFSREQDDLEYLYKGGLINECDYRWRVFAIDNIGLETQCISEFSFHVSTTPTTPIVVAMSRELRPEDKIAFTGATDPNPRDRLKYTLEIAANDRFESPTVHLDKFPHSAGTMTAVISELPGSEKMDDDADYYFRVRATDNHGYHGAYSTPSGFRFNRKNDAPGPAGSPFSPIGMDTVNTRNPELSWSAATDEDLTDSPERLMYNVRLDSDGELESSAAYEFPTGPGLTFFKVPVPLADNTVWSWQVRTRDDEGAVSHWSVMQQFLVNVDEDPPSPPMQIKPYNGQSLNILGPVDFEWTEAVDPDYGSSITYRMEYSKQANLSYAERIRDLSSRSVRVEGPLENITYYWRVIAVDNSGLETPSPITTLILDTRPTVPLLISPTNGVEISSRGTINWSNSGDPDPSDVVTYRMQVSSSADFSNLLIDLKGLKQVNQIISKLGGSDNMVDNTIYYWRVMASDNHGIASAWSESASFFYNFKNDPPTDFRLTSPANGKEVKTPKVTFRWEAPTDPDLGDRVSFTLFIAQDAEFTQIGNQFPGLTATEFTPPNGLIQAGITYFWKVVAEDGEGGATWGSNSDQVPFSFSVKAPVEAPAPQGTQEGKPEE